MIEKLIEIDSLIKQYKKDFLECRTEQDKREISKNIEKLEKIWFQNTNCNYPMLLNERATENNNLVNNVLYDKNYASDEVDNFRKRRK